MSVKPNRAPLRLITLLVATGLACIGAVAASLEEPASHCAREDDGRALDFTKVEEVTRVGTQKLTEAAKKFVAAAKLKLTSNNQQATDKLFKTLKVGQVKSNVLKSAEFQKWSTSVNKAYKKTPEAGNTAMVTTLTAHYGDEALAGTLVAAHEVSTTKTASVPLLNAQMKKWEDEKKSFDDVFKMLKLDKAGDNLLGNSALKPWISYVNRLKADPDELLFTKLATRYDDEGIAKRIYAAVGTPKSRSIRNKLEAIQLDKWHDARKTKDEVFNLLKLENLEGDKLLKNPALGAWANYVLMINKEDPYMLLLQKLSKTYDEELIKLILSTQKVASTNNIGLLLGMALPNYWLVKGKTADEAFDLLKLKNVAADDLLARPSWGNWVSYVDDLNRWNPEEPMYLVLKKRYGSDSLAVIMEKAKQNANTKSFATKMQEEIWREEGKSSSDVFDLLGLSTKYGEFLQKPAALTTWISYAAKLGELDTKNPTQFRAISELEKTYSAAELSRVVGDAMLLASKKGDDAVEKAAGGSQALQFREWMENGLNPNSVIEKIAVPHDRRNNKVMVDFVAFYHANPQMQC